MAIDEKVQNGVMRKINNSFQNSKLYKGIAGALGALALTYAVNTADISGKVNTAYAEESAEASAQPYKEMHIEDEYNFKDKIADSGLCWVMYNMDNEKLTHSDVDPKALDSRAKEFWQKLKINFGDQVDAYIHVDVTDWSNHGEKADKEIGEDAYPSFVLYNNGKVVNDGTDVDVRIKGAPPEKYMSQAIKYVKNNTNLE